MYFFTAGIPRAVFFVGRPTVWRSSSFGDRQFRCFYGFLAAIFSPILSISWLFQRFYHRARSFTTSFLDFISRRRGIPPMKNESIYTSLYGNISFETRPFFQRKFQRNLLVSLASRRNKFKGCVFDVPTSFAVINGLVSRFDRYVEIATVFSPRDFSNDTGVPSSARNIIRVHRNESLNESEDSLRLCPKRDTTD